MQLLAYLGALCVALFLAFFLPSHFLSVRDQIGRTSATATRSVPAIPPPRQSRPETTGTAARDLPEQSSAPASVAETGASTEKLSANPAPTLAPPSSEAVNTVDRPAAAAVTDHKSASKPKANKRNAVRQIKAERKLASRKRDTRMVANRLDSESRPLDGLEFWWKSQSRKDRTSERVHARFAHPTEFWWR
jgi:hypothetical protein